jgi:hypothetical protein
MISLVSVVQLLQYVGFFNGNPCATPGGAVAAVVACGTIVQRDPYLHPVRYRAGKGDDKADKYQGCPVDANETKLLPVAT